MASSRRADPGPRGRGRAGVRTVEEFVRIGITELLLVVNGDNSHARAQKLAELLPRLRSIGDA